MSIGTGWFITLEGGEGVGKTAVIHELKRYLQDMGIAVLATREPGGIDIAEQIRAIILNPANITMDARTELLLYAASRRQHLIEKVIPALSQGITVISDRYVDSTIVYQGYARGIGIDLALSINRFATEDLMPDLTIWLDLDPRQGLQRIGADKIREVNRLDMEQLDFHDKVREGYTLLQARFPQRIIRVDAEPPLNHVVKEVLNAVNDRLQAGKTRTDV